MNFLRPNRFPKLSGDVVLLKPRFVEDTCGLVCFLPCISVSGFCFFVLEVFMDLGRGNALPGCVDVADDVVLPEPVDEGLGVDVIQP